MTARLPDKLIFRIGEVAELVGVKAHVLRYWEEEFGVLHPMKTRGSHRQYRRRDVEIALILKRLLNDEGFTIAGAKKQLVEMGIRRRGKTLPRSSDRSILVSTRDAIASFLGRLQAEEKLEHDRLVSTSAVHKEQPETESIEPVRREEILIQPVARKDHFPI